MNHLQLTEIEHPGLHDVLWGRGGHTTCHPGNVRYRSLTQNYRDAFKSAGKIRRLEIANEIVQKWRDQSPPGRFLVMSEPEKGNDSFWHDIGDRGAVQKVMGSLRQRKPKSDIGYSNTGMNVFQQAMRQKPGAASDGNYAQSIAFLNSYSNWQQTFSNAANTSTIQESQRVTPPQALMTMNTVVSHTIAPSPNESTSAVGYNMSFPAVFAPSPSPCAASTVSENETGAVQKQSNTSASSHHAHNPSFVVSDNGSEEVPLAAALTINIFDEELQSGIPMCGGEHNKLWNISDLSFLAPAGVSCTQESLNLLFQEGCDPFAL